TGSNLFVEADCIWLKSSSVLLQHDGANAYFRTQAGKGGLYLGANGNNRLVINADGTLSLLGKLTVNVGASGVGLDLSSTDAYLNARVIRNVGGPDATMYIGYGGTAGGEILFYTGGTTQKAKLDNSGNF